VRCQRLAEPLADHLAEAAEALHRAGRLLVFLDFDGALAPVVEYPWRAVLPASNRDALAALVRKSQVTVAVISGRSLDDLESRVDVDGLIYAGNHGLEIHGPTFRFTEPRAMAARPVLRGVREALAEKIRPIHGAWIEDKGLTMSLHFRLADRADLPILQSATADAVEGSNDVRCLPGNEVYEFWPKTNWHQEAAVRWITRALKWEDAAKFYVGDDTADEETFALLPEAITIKVGGSSETWARYCLPGTEAVSALLAWLNHATH